MWHDEGGGGWGEEGENKVCLGVKFSIFPPQTDATASHDATVPTSLLIIILKQLKQIHK